MNSSLYKSCCCGNCDCLEDSNGYWGKPNQDFAYECCWSVGDRVQYKHDAEVNYEHRAGGVVPKTNPCYPQSYTCGRVLRKSNVLVDVQYVCIGSRGNFHTGPTTDSQYEGLPEYIYGNDSEGNGSASPTGDGWNISPVLYQPANDPSTGQIPPYENEIGEGDTWDYGEYIQNPAHISGMYTGLPFNYYKKYDGFEAKQGDGGGFFWSPIEIPANTDTEYDVGTLSTSSTCIDCFLSNKDVYRCGAGEHLNCENMENGVPVDCILEGEPGDGSDGPCLCNPDFIYGSDVPPFVCRNAGQDCEYCLHPDDCGRINKCNPNSDCSCFKADYLKEEDLNTDNFGTDFGTDIVDENYEIDTEGYVLDTDGERILKGYQGRYEHKIYNAATIFALDLTDPNIKYCRGKYWVEFEVDTGTGTKYQQYELEPFLVLYHRPIKEWDCDCKDENGDYYLPDGVGKYKRKNVEGGFVWKTWSGNSDGCCPVCPGGIGPQCIDFVRNLWVCVADCELEQNTYQAGSGYVPCTRSSPLDAADTKFYPFFENKTTLGSQSTADFFRCKNCVEGISSCGGFKGYCIKRRNVIPDKENACPGQCEGFYGTMVKSADYDCNDANIVPSVFSCNYGCAENNGCGQTCEKQYINEFGYEDDDENPVILIPPTPYMRSECVAYTTNILTILPVDQEKRRCLWNEFQITNNEGETQRCGCCGIYSEGSGLGKDVGAPLDISNPYGDLIFSWTEGIGWDDTCEDIGTVLSDLLEEGSEDEYFKAEACDENGNCSSISGPTTLCEEDPSICDPVQCSGTTAFISGKEMATGNYPCVLGPIQRSCCKLPFSLSCPQDTPWPYYSSGPLYTHETEQYWQEQKIIPSSNKLIGCNCVPPSCECYDIWNDEITETYPGRYDPIDEDPKRCDADNYTKISHYRQCFDGCSVYDFDLYGCRYDPDNPSGTVTDDCIGPKCPGPYPGGCDDTKDCPKYCVCESEFGGGSFGWECVGDCSELDNPDANISCIETDPP